MVCLLHGCLAWIVAMAPPQEAGARVLVAGANEQRSGEFEALLRKHGMRTARASCRELTKETARGFDVVIVDPETGPARADGLSAKLGEWEAQDLCRPTLVIGTPGGHALKPLKLKFGRNG